MRRAFGAGIPRWDEPLTISLGGERVVYIFAFGVVVFIGYTGSPEERRILDVLREAVEPRPREEEYREEYAWVPGSAPRERRGIRVQLPSGAVVIRNEAIYGPLDETAKRILALVIAQSAALRRLEAEADSLLEEVDLILESLVSSRMPRIGRARQSLIQALRTRNTLEGDLLILEKPPAAWEDERYERLLEGLRYVFEIEERYTALDRKLSNTLETIEVIVSLVNEARFILLETLIVLFFLLEILLTLVK
ncbi:MAG: RMD1 family protein [Desulfurococcales archaeon]|nr:RMD1 family protein [Desulfurococcales archaeon]